MNAKVALEKVTISRRTTQMETDKELDSCPICLSQYQNQSFTVGCYHSYCFSCIKRWTILFPYCPLCKTKVESIVYDILTDSEFKVHYLQQHQHTPRKIYRQRQWGRISEDDRKWIKQLEYRRSIYVLKRKAKHVGLNSSSKIPDFRPVYFKKYPQKVKLLTGWIRRELNAIIPNSPVELVREYIQTLIQTHHIQSDVAKDLLSQYLYEDTELFVHELVCFGNSSLNMNDYDKYVQYE